MLERDAHVLKLIAGAWRRQAAEAEYREVTEEAKQEVVGLGGLHVIGTERHESRRIDNQLRGRSGRQGDPGSTRYFLSLEDKFDPPPFCFFYLVPSFFPSFLSDILLS